MNPLKSAWWRDSLFLILLLLAAPFFLVDYQLSNLTLLFPYAMAAMALSLVWGYCGILALGQATFFGIGAYAMAKEVQSQGSNPGLILGLLFGLLISGILAWLIARLSFGYKIDAFVISITTFCTTAAFEQLAIKFSKFTGGENGIPVNPVLPTAVVPSYLITFAVFALTLGCLVLIVRSDWGKQIAAIAGNEGRLRHFGVNTDKVKRQVFVVGAVVTSIAGALDALTSGIAATNKIGFEFSTLILLWCAIGGRKSLASAAFGTLFINMVANQLSDQIANYWQLILAVLFIGIVVFLPDGLYFPLKRLGKRINLRPQLDIVVSEPTNSDADVEIAFEGSGIKQKYGDFVALNIENIEFSKGVVAALIGPNGAGKTTFISYLSGGLRDAAGNSSVFGNSIERKYDFEIAQMGVKRKFQTPSVFEDMSIQDNLFLGAAQPLTFPKSWFSRSHELSLPREVIALAQEASLLDHSSESAGDLSHGAKQFLEVCMVLASQPHLLLLDEPTAGMIQKDRYRIGEVIKDLAKQGRAILIVEHDFDFVRSISDRIYVLHQGSLITLGSPKEVSRNSQVRELYLGSSV